MPNVSILIASRAALASEAVLGASEASSFFAASYLDVSACYVVQTILEG